jgi:hypothetical protein
MSARIGALGPLDFSQAPPVGSDPTYLEIYDDALDAMARKGLHPPSLPASFDGNMPSDLTSLDDEHLGDLLNQMSAWCAFIEFELAKVAAQRSGAEANLDEMKARVRIRLKADDAGKKMPQKDKDDAVETHEEVRKANKHYIFMDSLYGLVRVLRDKAQRDWETVSRRITQRGQEVERMKRETNVAGVPVASRFRRGTR